MNAEAMDLFLKAAEPSIVERIDLPSRPERRTKPPRGYRTGRTGGWLSAMVGGKDTVWTHQAKALEHVVAKRHVVIATATASGKSIVFQAAAIREMIEGEGTVLVLYPQKALGGDQLVRWRKALAAADLPESLVGEINGDVPMGEREQVIAAARIILGTPDAINAWMMRHATAPGIQAFLGKLRLLVADEAHTFEGVFGSTAAYLFRRLRSLVASIKSRISNPVQPLQMIAATATIADPQEHMLRLTGMPFALVGDDENGAPSHGLTLLHIDGTVHGAPAEKKLAEIVTKLAGEIAPGAVIAFADKRQGVERICRRIGGDEVLPYRGGYERGDRKDIEDALRAGRLRGVVSTSALELGIDIPQFTVGLNLGIPQTRKALRQRVGRVGRSAPGVFAVIAPRHAFAELGGSFAEFYNGAIEPCHLYLDNPLIQFQQACCLREEFAVEDGVAALPDEVEWPEGFSQVFDLTEPGAPRSPELDRIAMLGTGNPHLDYPLRRIGEGEFALRPVRSPSTKIGTITLDKALREAFPGAVYIHMRKPYRVVNWRITGHESTILLEPTSGGDQPKPLLNAIVSMSQAGTDLIEGRLVASESGSMAETCVRVVESVYGYSVSGKAMLYSDLAKANPRMRTKNREFSSTGVVMRINEPWFKGSGEHQLAARRNLAHALALVLMRDRSISPSDVTAVHTGIAIHGPGGSRKLDDAIAIFDDVQGGLRLTTALFDNLKTYIARLRRATELVGSKALLSPTTIDQFEAWFRSLEAPSAPTAAFEPVAHEEHELIIFAPGSRVHIRMGGMSHERRLIGHQLATIGDNTQLMYQYESQPGVRAWVPHELVEPLGDDWQRMIWNPANDTLREISDVA
jgi:DEAD/DEAH box helicase domain-containing protein